MLLPLKFCDPTDNASSTGKELCSHWPLEAVRLSRKDHSMGRGSWVHGGWGCVWLVSAASVQDRVGKCMTQKGLSHRSSYLVEVFNKVHLGTFGGEADIQCGVLLAVEREREEWG